MVPSSPSTIGRPRAGDRDPDWHVRVVRVVENVQAGRHGIVGVATDGTAVLRLEGVGIESRSSVDRFAHGDIGGREVDHPGHTTVCPGVEPTRVSPGGGSRKGKSGPCLYSV